MLFAIFTFLHLYCNYKAVSAVVMETVNLPRYHILVKNYLKNLRIMTPRDVGKLDPVLLGRCSESLNLTFLFKTNR